MDNELEQLRRQVYEVTGWHDSLLMSPAIDLLPRYTSDYLLEKLPRFIVDNAGSEKDLMLLPVMDNGWSAFYEGAGAMVKPAIEDTPLKALLKLTVALADSGQLTTEEEK